MVGWPGASSECRLPQAGCHVCCDSLARPGGTASAARQMTKLDVLRAAKKGKTAPQILRQAFPGTRHVRSLEAPIRVLLLDEVLPSCSRGRPTSRSPTRQTHPPGARSRATHRFQVKRADGKYRVSDLDDPQSRRTCSPAPIVVDSGTSPTGIRVADPLDRRYRGALRSSTVARPRSAWPTTWTSRTTSSARCPATCPPRGERSAVCAACGSHRAALAGAHPAQAFDRPVRLHRRRPPVPRTRRRTRLHHKSGSGSPAGSR